MKSYKVRLIEEITKHNKSVPWSQEVNWLSKGSDIDQRFEETIYILPQFRVHLHLPIQNKIVKCSHMYVFEKTINEL